MFRPNQTAEANGKQVRRKYGAAVRTWGQSAMDYALLLAFLSLLVLAAMNFMRGGIEEMFAKLGNMLANIAR